MRTQTSKISSPYGWQFIMTAITKIAWRNIIGNFITPLNKNVVASTYYYNINIIYKTQIPKLHIEINKVYMLNF